MQSHAALELAHEEGAADEGMDSSDAPRPAVREGTLASFLPVLSVPTPKAKALAPEQVMIPLLQDGHPHIEGRTVWSPQDVNTLKAGYEKHGPRWRAIARDKSLLFSPGIRDCGLKQRSNKLKSYFCLHKSDFV